MGKFEALKGAGGGFRRVAGVGILGGAKARLGGLDWATVPGFYLVASITI